MDKRFQDVIQMINKLSDEMKDFKIQIRKGYKSDIVEIDNFSELVALDPSYKDYPGHENF